MAANFSAEENNAKLKFEFMLHADKTAAAKWQELPIPFPSQTPNKNAEIKVPSHVQPVVYPDNVAERR